MLGRADDKQSSEEPGRRPLTNTGPDDPPRINRGVRCAVLAL
jgi:hypothetical protein